MPYLELFLRRWVTTFLLLPTAVFMGHWAACAGLICLSAISDLIASRYLPMVPIRVFADDAGSESGYAPLVPDRASTPIWYRPLVGAILIVWIGCLPFLRGPSETIAGRMTFWCVYLVIPPLTAYTTRIAARFLSQRRSKSSFTLKDVYVTNVYTAPGALLKDRTGMPQSGLPLIAVALMLGMLFGLMFVTLEGLADQAAGAQLLWVCPAGLLMLLMAGSVLIQLPEHLYLPRRQFRLWSSCPDQPSGCDPLTCTSRD